jgi:hypothetical protein
MFCHLPLFLAAPVVATLILAGTPAQATGYQLLLCQDADAPQCPLRVVIQEKDSGRITSMELQPGKALDLRDDQNYGFQFINKLGPERPSQEAAFCLHRTGEAEPVGRFVYWSGRPHLLRVHLQPCEGFAALKAFSGQHEHHDHKVAWRNGALAWFQADLEAAAHPREERKQPAPNPLPKPSGAKGKE